MFGCAGNSSYVYQPETANATTAGLPAAQTPIPPEAVASRTSFDRVDRQPETVAYAEPWPLWAGWGPYWWYDPFYPRVVFIHAHPYRFHGTGHVVVGGFGGRFRAVAAGEDGALAGR